MIHEAAPINKLRGLAKFDVHVYIVIVWSIASCRTLLYVRFPTRTLSSLPFLYLMPYSA